jgi:hypothetical protein
VVAGKFGDDKWWPPVANDAAPDFQGFRPA